MNGLTLGLLIAAGVIVTVGVSLAVFFNLLQQRLETEGTERIQAKFPTEQILRSETTANFVGLESRGRGQIRGSGVLVLTQNELWFSRLVPRDDISIPLHQIQEMQLVDSHLGKQFLGRKLMYVQFQPSQGKDAAAWAVGDPEAWQRAIASAKSGR